MAKVNLFELVLVFIIIISLFLVYQVHLNETNKETKQSVKQPEELKTLDNSATPFGIQCVITGKWLVPEETGLGSSIQLADFNENPLNWKMKKGDASNVSNASKICCVDNEHLVFDPSQIKLWAPTGTSQEIRLKDGLIEQIDTGKVLNSQLAFVRERELCHIWKIKSD